MKVCFLLQRKFAYLGHEFAVVLKEKYNVTDFCGYVFLRHSYNYLKNQKEINYSSLLLDEDIHLRYKDEKLDLEYLKKIEKEYGIPNLWPYIELDRIIRNGQLVREYPYNQTKYSHEELMRMLQVRIKAIIEFLETEKPDFLIYAAIGSISGLLMYHIAKKMGIKVLSISFSRVENYYLFSEHYSNFTSVDELFNKFKVNDQKHELFDEAKKIVDKFINQPRMIEVDIDSYLKRSKLSKQMSFLKPKKIYKYFVWLYRSIKRSFDQDLKNDYSSINPYLKVLDQFKRKLRNLRGFSDLYDQPDYQENFVFFPLHEEPEIAITLLAPYYCDQINLIKQIAKSIPIDFKIYVKEHPGMIGYRPRNFYKELKKIPNLKLINPGVNVYKILPHAKLITTITGTAGFEALYFKKPVITFGDVFYNSISAVKRCSELDQLPYLVKDQIENFNFNENEFINYISCILSESVTISFQHLWFNETDKQKKMNQLIPLVDLFIKKFK